MSSYREYQHRTKMYVLLHSITPQNEDVLLQRMPELGTRQYCRDNETMFSGHKVVCYCSITIFGVAIPSKHRDLNIFLDPEAL